MSVSDFKATYCRPGPTYLVVVVGVATVATPGTDTDVQLAVRKGADELLQVGEVLGGVDADDLAVAHMHAVLELILGVLAGLRPGSVEVLHEVGVALAGLGITDLLGDHVATRADDDGHIEEVVAAKA